MKFLLPQVVFAVLVTQSSLATAQIYRCDSESGVPLYQNAPGPRCKPMELPSITTVPAPASPAGRSGAGATSTSTATSSMPTPAQFPRVDNAAQRARDADRRSILEDELRREEAKLNSLRAEFNNGEPDRRGDERNYQKYLDRTQRLKDDIARVEGSVASLKRELGAIRD
jgi:hypothetical protein